MNAKASKKPGEKNLKNFISNMNRQEKGEKQLELDNYGKKL